MPLKTEFTHEERVANGKNGGIKSGRVRKEKAKIKDQLNMMLQLYMKDPKENKPKKLSSIKSVDEMNVKKGYNGTVQEALLMKQIQQAMNGNVRSFELIVSLIGETPAPPKPKEMSEEDEELDNSMQENQMELIDLLKGRKVERFNEDEEN